jgi:hypothetical protein
MRSFMGLIARTQGRIFGEERLKGSTSSLLGFDPMQDPDNR